MEHRLRNPTAILEFAPSELAYARHHDRQSYVTMNGQV